MKRRTTKKTKRNRNIILQAVVPILFLLLLFAVRNQDAQSASSGDEVTIEDVTGSAEESAPDVSVSVAETTDTGSVETVEALPDTQDNMAGDSLSSVQDPESVEKMPYSEPVFPGLEEIPAYEGEPFTEVNGNVPYFTDDDLSTVSYEHYGELDDLGRCTAAFACVGPDLMPTEERGSIGNIKPTGWHQNKYEVGTDVDSPWLYNRCHLIAYQLTGENDNPKNLITGTRVFNLRMLVYENMVADYIKNTGNHVLYRVTPVFDGDDLLARGVLMEGESVEDDGAGITFCVFCHNVQQGITLDYATGENWAAE